ncbi:hypothetical protein AB9T89_10305 [Flavobacterium oncorhynchi]|uniref:hypothetical protein n=1 Tax=Flavobacterium oncorhynchi TaxID=728056 RepID=UPI00351A17A1
MENLRIIEFWKTGENPITCYNSRPCISIEKEMPKKQKKEKEIRPDNFMPQGRKQAVIVLDKKGNKTEYESVVRTSEALNINSSSLYAILNGRLENKTEYQIFKSTLNN